MWFFKDRPKAAIPKRDFVSIRMEAIGGQGANSAGKVLAEAAVLGMGYNGNHFSSFSSEKRGSPVRSFVRFSTNKFPVRSASFIKNPDILMVFHESLLSTHQEVLSGTTENTDLILNSNKRPSEIEFPTGTQLRKVYTFNATSIAMNSKCGLNAVMLGAVSSICPEVSRKVLQDTLDRYFSSLSSEIRANNIHGFKNAQKKIKSELFNVKQAHQKSQNAALPEMGWLNAPLGGVIVNPGNSVLKDHSASRKGIAPQFTKELCFNCGFCDMVCPDFCFVWKIDPNGEQAPDLQGIDYQYCKGCQKCISVCPVEALKPVLESEISVNERALKLFPEADSHLVEDHWRKMDWSTYVEHLSKDGQMMSIQTELLDPKSYLRPDFPDEIKKIVEEKAKKESR
jgi:pyruvate ferredoxin oxidoreductase gamma subunit